VVIFLDSNIVIYAIETTHSFHARARTHLGALRAAGHTFAVSDLVRLGRRVRPIRNGDSVLLAEFDAFFAAIEVQVLSLTSAVCDRATLVRAALNFKTPDSLQLAAAIVHGCDRFLTADARLNACTDITVDVLP
jgi:predicted nucleic acid-binding protein